ncbi:MAG: Hpt domain-containing protein [Deltaproteobacteria bacterium]|nr:Hpt domain-containing protein [Deltaproteobacteria bacterium]
MLIDVLNGFLENARYQIETLQKAISKNDFEEIRREAHTIKGGAANLVAKELSMIALNLEKHATSEDIEGCRKHLEKLKTESEY